jgi:hypothetical protein
LISKKRFLEILRDNKGNVSVSCKVANISRGTYYKWINKDNKFKKECESIKDETLEFVESKLMEKIESGDLGAIIFYLKTQGKKKGWNEKFEPTKEESNIRNKVIEVVFVDSDNKE